MSANAAKAWTDGELFRGGDLNRLLANGTGRFASAAARNAALVGDYAPVAGTRAALQDDHLTYKYNGSVWTPPPGTAMFDYYQSASQSLTNSAWTTIASYPTNVLGRNWGNWFVSATGKFTPQLAGWYELTGSVPVYHNTETSGYRQVGFRQNGTLLIISSCLYLSGGKTGVTIFCECKPTMVYFNGTTDYAELACFQNAGALTTGATGARFAATYQGN